ncbi:class I SAM-dependent methyltransferase [Candidatus Poribacteria bacterium]|nr:class I SAM-dependent methyltransferase [Candidatus Poribacteria bacterium]
MSTRTTTLERLQSILDALEAFDPSELPDRRFYDDLISATRMFHDGVRDARVDPKVDDVRFALDLTKYVLEEFPRILRDSPKRFWLDARYEIGAQEFDLTYTYQDALAAERVLKLNPRYFVDVGSTVSFVTLVSRSVRCIAIDARPTPFALHNLVYRQAEAQELPFTDGSVPLLTSLHASEHFGLGRYGDTVDNMAFRKAVREYQRVVQIGGHLIISVPTQLEPTTLFNSMNLFTPELLQSHFPRCRVVDEIFLCGVPVTRETHDTALRENPSSWGAYMAIFQREH